MTAKKPQKETPLAIQWQHAVRDTEELTPTQKCIAFVLGTYFDNNTLVAWPGNALIAKGSGYTKRTVQRALERLETKGFLLCVKRGSAPKGGPRQANEWQGLLPATQCRHSESRLATLRHATGDTEARNWRQKQPPNYERTTYKNSERRAAKTQPLEAGRWGVLECSECGRAVDGGNDVVFVPAGTYGLCETCARRARLAELKASTEPLAARRVAE